MTDTPVIVTDAESKPFWDAVTRGELLLQRCADCTHAVFPARAVCPHCFGTRLLPHTAAGTGTVHSKTVVHRAFGPFAQQTPFTIALIDLDEGVRMMSRIVGGAPVAIGDRVRLHVTRLVDAPDAPELPCFRAEVEA
ncbi:MULTISPECIES: Zn-ribbon domain-containing OB-fold protein [unclassified Streptomyces]|uniref:Zn-ribbon domain-containing OB-fold protein n=1 Tax=unclassified Streptomyces TaxID=2593676 RepID=UPI002E300C44|nr:Zn-ribbon domain-containing OB-fold protein [Streptomyces sp. NBC_01280]WSE13126.1 Zn-ribbon domain-containing OB-fold protein [Streptomyces sp. NBC_01397]